MEMIQLVPLSWFRVDLHWRFDLFSGCEHSTSVDVTYLTVLDIKWTRWNVSKSKGSRPYKYEYRNLHFGTCSLTCQHLCHQQGSRCFPRLFLFPRKQEPHYSPTKGTDLQWKFDRPPPSRQLRSNKWQSNHYKVGTGFWGEGWVGWGGWGTEVWEEELVTPQTNAVISTFRGSLNRWPGLWEFDLSESVWSHEMWGQTQTMGKGTNGRAITGL